MSRRTALASTAIRKAWEKEKELVSEGKGTRDWTAAQQKDILDENIGKAYDENGKAFEGHHMQSAEACPQYQGEPLNIQFLTREEHKEAHQGDFRNPTNGYFDPITHTTRSFGDGKFVPCEVISLSHPICKPVIDVKPSEKEKEKETEAKKTTGTDPPEKKTIQAEKTQTAASPKPDVKSEKHPILNKIKKVVSFAWKEVIQPAGQYVKDHPIETAFAVCQIVGDIVYEVASSGSSSLTTGIPKSASVNNTQPINSTGNETPNGTPSVKEPTSVGKTLTEKQLVHSHFQRYGNDKHWVKVPEYTRGPKSNS